MTPSPSRLGPAGGYGYGGYANGTGLGVGTGGGAAGFRPATPNRKGQYSDAVLSELESQNDAQVEGIMGKVRILKDVSLLAITSVISSSLSFPPGASKISSKGIITDDAGLKIMQMTVAIGDEIRESSALAEKMNDTFDQTRLRLRGTMNRMLLMAERTGVGWKVWLGFFGLVCFLFMYVWLF